jgi:hypothetical protein
MDYIRQLNEFDRWQETHPMPPSARLLWFVLMQVNNKTGWAKRFTVSIRMLSEKTGLSAKTVQMARNALEAEGLIRAFKQKGRKCCGYEMRPVVSNINAQNDAINNTKTNTKTIALFSAPSVEEVKTYCLERGNRIDAEQFMNYYAARGWKIGASEMNDWRAAVRSWEKRERKGPRNENVRGNYSGSTPIRGIERA